MAFSRKLRARALAAPLLMLALAGGVASAAPSAVVGVTAAILNDVRIKGAAARQYAKAVLRQRVALADQVQTGAASRLQLLLLDQSKFTVGPNARLTIDRFVYDPNGGALSATVAKGAFRFMSGRAGPNKRATINSPSASIGIRGTLIDGAVGQLAVTIARGERELRGNLGHDPATATLVVLRGPGPRRQGNDRVGAIDVSGGGQTVSLDRPLQAAYVPYAGAAPITFTISSPGIARLNDLLFEPQSVLYDPNATPVMPPAGNDRPYYDYYDRPPPPPPGMRDGPGPSFNGGNYIPSMPGMNRNVPPQPDRPTNQRGRNPTPSQSSGLDTPSSVPTTTTGTPNDPPPTTGNNPRPSSSSGSPPPTTSSTTSYGTPSDSPADPYGSQNPTTSSGDTSLTPNGRTPRPTRTQGQSPTGIGTTGQPQGSGGATSGVNGQGSNGQGVNGQGSGTLRPIGTLRPSDRPVLRLPPSDPPPPEVR